LLDQGFGCLAGMCGEQVGGMVRGFEIVREGRTFALGFALADRLEFFLAFENKLVFVLGGWGSVVVRQELRKR
jgi:hypothetical protein